MHASSSGLAVSESFLLVICLNNAMLCGSAMAVVVVVVLKMVVVVAKNRITECLLAALASLYQKSVLASHLSP